MMKRLFSILSCFLLLTGFVKAGIPGDSAWSPRKAKEWLRKGDWKNGLSLKPHASVDAVDFATQYHANQATWDKVIAWLKTQPLQTIAPGKYPIDGDNAFAIVSQGPTKALADTKWESHHDYIDLHYVISGKEQLGEAPLATAKVTHPFDGTSDNANYDTDNGQFYTAEPGTFFLFFPENVHRAGIAASGTPQDKKLVIKIRMAYAPRTVVLDYYFNHEWTKNWTRYHYTWEDQTNNGFSKLGGLFRDAGFKTDTLAVAPTFHNLQDASVYIIVDPDTETETPHPNYVSPADVTAVTEWVKKGGVLVLMGNDKGNCELDHFNLLSTAFGIRFNEDCKLHVVGEDRVPGLLPIPAGNALFTNAKVLYLKDVSSLSVQPPATAAVTKDGDVIMATAKFGRGTVFVVGDPWIYNEYIESAKLPAEVQNMEGAREWVRWLNAQITE